MADIRADYAGPKLKKDAGVFTMGSCFAREIEGALLALGGNVVSVDRELISPSERPHRTNSCLHG